ncbi:apoptosis-associated speck-like protein containing a CARD [Rhincodon typus]|uniref:apoptosis-associated speck-like protein containing a CARD n=1 Tax=Rhincodon typus TaxID=259920 RepID=UPI0009A420BC|nr:apoptosis-associated speck-like protein containing a CARD [Rhincodon typus]
MEPGAKGHKIVSNITVDGGSTVFSPNIQGLNSATIKMSTNSSSKPHGEKARNKMPLAPMKKINTKELEGKVTDKKSFVQQNWANLVQKVQNVDELADQMMGFGLTNEMYSEIMSCKTSQEKMRKLLQYMTVSDNACKHLFTKLCELQYCVMEELIQ